MFEPGIHRKTIRHFDAPGHAHELTFSCFQRRPLLENDEFRALFSEAINRAVVAHRYELVAFVYMPEHVDLLVRPAAGDANSISDLLYAIKRPASFRIKQVMERYNDPLLPTLTIRERPGKTTFRLWQEGPGFDRNIQADDHLVVAVNYIHNNPVRRRLSLTPGGYRWSSWHAYEDPNRSDPFLPSVTRWRS